MPRAEGTTFVKALKRRGTRPYFERNKMVPFGLASFSSKAGVAGEGRTQGAVGMRRTRGS